VFATDEIFEIIIKAYSEYFTGTYNYKILRCLTFLKEPSSTGELVSLIITTHVNKNHRGVDEMYAHLKREIYEPHLKSLIAQAIRDCRQQ